MCSVNNFNLATMDLKLLCTILLTSVISIKAEDFRITIGDWSYLSHSEKLSWDDAESYCKNHGMNLISIDTPTQFKNAQTVAKQNNIGNQPIWTSGTDARHESNFVWSANGQDFDHAPWHSSEPNSLSYEDCVTLVMWGESFGLNDDECYKHFEVFCSREN